MIKKGMACILVIMFLIASCNVALADVAFGPTIYIVPLLLFGLAIFILVVIAGAIIRFVRKNNNKTADKKGDSE